MPPAAPAIETTVVDGLGLAKEIRQELAQEVQALVDTGLRPPCLAVVLVGDDPASESYVKVKGKQAKAMADQIATVSKLRLNSKQGTVSKSDMRGVDAAIKTQLNLN